MKYLITSAIGALILAAAVTSAGATPLTQDASEVIGFSSQYTASSWSAAQVLGKPDTMQYGDYASAWAPYNRNDTLEFISVGFDTAVYSNGAIIRETAGNGFVYQVDVIDTAGKYHKAWRGIDTSPADEPSNFAVSWDFTPFLVTGLKIYVNTSRTVSWEEIDSIALVGDTELPVARVPEPASLALLGLGIGLFGIARRRRAA